MKEVAALEALEERRAPQPPPKATVPAGAPGVVRLSARDGID
eukprot:gene11222-7829_t